MTTFVDEHGDEWLNKDDYFENKNYRKKLSANTQKALEGTIKWWKEYRKKYP